MDLVRGKAQDTMAPCGPALMPACFVSDVNDLRITLSVNGKTMMDASTAEILYRVDEQLSLISGYMTLVPGDILFTGSPSGSAGVHGDRWLRDGDRIRAEIEQVGVLDVSVHDDAGAPMTRESPAIDGLHHLKLPVADLDQALGFYQRVLGAERIPEADHHRQGDGSLYAMILKVPGLGTMLELRLNPEQAGHQRGFDPFTIAVADRATLDDWVAFLDGIGVPHSSVLTAIQAWVLVVEDRDGHRFRLYTRETHGRDLKPDEDDPWLRD